MGKNDLLFAGFGSSTEWERFTVTYNEDIKIN